MSEVLRRPGEISFEQEPGITAISAQTGLAQVIINVKPDNGVINETIKVLKILQDVKVSVDLLKLGQNCLSFVVDETVLDVVTKSLSEFENIKIKKGRVLLSVIAANMREIIGVMATVSSAMLETGAAIEQTSDSHNRAMVLIEEQYLKSVIIALKKVFNLEESNA